MQAAPFPMYSEIRPDGFGDQYIMKRKAMYTTGSLFFAEVVWYNAGQE